MLTRISLSTWLASALCVALLSASPVRAQGDALSLSAPEAFALAQQGRITIVDIRRPDEWRDTGAAQGVERLDMRHPGGPQGFAQALLERLGGDRDAPIALICRTGNRTTRVQAALREMGFTNVYNIAEGMAGSRHGPGWIARGLPVEACPAC
ncbi:MAG TPA: rhodanese-like domain-containing protein [Rhodocyclaceae bacterium]|nr:rhodanese-like domain-containing protein [Rhodocyclaceae bacterium]